MTVAVYRVRSVCFPGDPQAKKTACLTGGGVRNRPERAKNEKGGDVIFSL